MRAIFIDAQKKEVTEINLPDNEVLLHAEIMRLIGSTDMDTLPVGQHSMMQIFLDRDCLYKENAGFTCSLLPESYPLFGSQVLLGRDIADGRAKPLYHFMDIDKLGVQFLSVEAAAAARDRQRKQVARFHQQN